MGEEKRHEMMETLFGAESEDSDDEPEPARQAISDQVSDRSVSSPHCPLHAFAFIILSFNPYLLFSGRGPHLAITLKVTR